MLFGQRLLYNTMWIWRNPKSALDFYNSVSGIRYLSNKSAWISKIKRKLYLRRYPTLLVAHDGSTYTIRHYEPRKIIKLPLDISTLSEELQQEILYRRKPKKKVVIEEEIEDNFDSAKYIKLVQKQAR